MSRSNPDSNWKRNGRLYWIVALLVAAAISILMVSMAIGHNPQGEFKNLETGALEFQAVLLFLSWLISVLLSFGLARILYRLFIFLNSLKKPGV
ncbi:MAG: hypothetical protein LBR60_02745 [Fibrobacter sp.]|nr:hypothetical protein [Fibrobacter sp.]